MYGPDEIDRLLGESSEKEKQVSLRKKRQTKEPSSVSEDEGFDSGIQEFYKRSIS